MRKSNDYVSKMIELAGGKYIFNDLGTDEEGLSTMNMGMEDFYAEPRMRIISFITVPLTASVVL